MHPVTGRCAILFPHGVLFRDEEQKMREKLVEDDVIECVLGLGPNLFYNSPMEACVVVCRMKKPTGRKGKILFINAVNEVTRERSQSFLEEEHIQKILRVFRDFKDVEGFAKVASNDEIRAHQSSLSIALYVRPKNGNGNVAEKPLKHAITEWQQSSEALRNSMESLFFALKEVGLDEH
jgi:type I restriction enzyme M protein